MPYFYLFSITKENIIQVRLEQHRKLKLQFQTNALWKEEATKKKSSDVGS